MEVNSREIKREFQPLVSIVTPSYNASSFIKETIQSVQSQTYKKWEMIIIDDVSKDNTCELIKEEIKKTIAFG